jgi:UTP--glucose-1-phosphate uridylyltransferase
MSEKFIPFARRMKKANLPDTIINIFGYYYARLLAGQTGFISESEIEPVAKLPDVEEFPERFRKIGQDALPKTILLKLNGGLGTSMGLEKAKSLLTVKDGLTFLDIIAQQASIPLVLMDSFATRDDSLALMKKYPALWNNVPLDFLQHKIPKITQIDFNPVDWPDNPDLEWCPPGHGDIYAALVTSGMLDTLLQAGYEYAFVSNSDNLGAVVDEAILGYFVENNTPFIMEVADRTEADKKGGHLAQLPDGQLILRESAQCLPDDKTAFQNIKRYKYFNTNNLWLNLPALKTVMTAKNNILELPMIRNAKTVDPLNEDSTPVYQLETAMGSAIGVFENAQAVRVPRTRFAPVKTTEDFLAVHSDLYILTEDFRVILNPSRQLDSIVINLDPTHYTLISDLENHFPAGVPSLIDCQELTIEGDIKFGRNVTLKGRVTLVNETDQQIEIEDNTVITGE